MNYREEERADVLNEDAMLKTELENPEEFDIEMPEKKSKYARNRHLYDLAVGIHFNLASL